MPYRLEPDRPVGEEVRRVALACIDDALTHLDRLGTPGMDGNAAETAVHETRKRCKELRGLLRLVRPALGSQHGRLNAHARDAAKELSTLRDAQTLLDTVEGLQGAVDDAEARHLDAVRGHRAVLAEAATHAMDTEDPRITRATARLTAARILVEVWDLPDDVDALTAGLGRSYRRGRKALRSARKHPHDEPVHEWRKLVKYLWYQARLLAPADADALAPLVDELDELDDLSDLLGEDHDLAVLVEHLERDAHADALEGVDIEPAIALARRRQADLRSDAFDLGRRVYADKPKEFVRRLMSPWAAAIDARRRDDEHATVERERTFLVADIPELPDEGTRIAQGYLALDRSVAVRVRDAGDKGRTLTVKGGEGSVRTELEWQIGRDRFDAAWPLTEGRRVEKTRYRVPLPDTDLVAELDVFVGACAGLVVVEVEFESDEAMDAFEPPAWFGPEVTDDPRYANAALAVDGLQPGMGANSR
ncbi:MAG: CHAD domain-containing protein [Acidimicrobiales bacterium]